MLKKQLSLLFFLQVVFNSAASIGHAIASPGNEYIPGFAIAIQHETVNQSVDYSPNLEVGTLAAPVEKPRFQAYGIQLSYTPDRRTRYALGVSQHEMNSLRDAFFINQLTAGVQRQILRPDESSVSLDLGFNMQVNHASEIYKNSYTNYNDQLINEVRLVEPSDVRLSMRANLGVALTHRLQMNVALSGGMSQTSQKKVVGSARLDNDCRYAFSASAQGGSVNQLERCGSLISYDQYYPSDRALNDRLGFSVTNDLTYRDYFLGSQASLAWQLGSWRVEGGYEFRQYFRPTLDHRIRSAGAIPVTRSHSAFGGASFDLLRHWQLNARVHYQRAAFLDDVPFLYTALTHQRYRGDGVIRYALTITRFFR